MILQKNPALEERSSRVVSSTIAHFEQKTFNANRDTCQNLRTEDRASTSRNRSQSENILKDLHIWNNNNSGITSLQRRAFYVADHCEMCSASRRLHSSKFDQNASLDERRASLSLREKITPFRRQSVKSTDSSNNRRNSVDSKAASNYKDCSCPCHRLTAFDHMTPTFISKLLILN